MKTIADLLKVRAEDPRPGLRFEDDTWSWAECVGEMAARGHWLRSQWRDGLAHVGVLLENTPEFHFWLGACALSGATLVGLNPTRRGDELAGDIAHTGCGLVIVDDATRPLLEGVSVSAPVVAPEDLDLHGREDRSPSVFPSVDPRTPLLLLFTSGTTAAPRAVVCTQGRLAGISERVAAGFGLGPHDVAYGSMPLFHSNAIMACWGPALAAGATLVLRRRFSASGFMHDVRRYGATYANYVGKPLAYVLATPEHPDDADNPLRLVFGNEGSAGDIEQFGRRFGCTVIDGYGSTEGAITMARTPATPAGALGRPGAEVVIRHPSTSAVCAVAQLDPQGRLLNPEDAIGELTTSNVSSFEGYYDNAEADGQRVRDGIYWSGDLAYRDADGYVYFAGRTAEWLRVDGENLATAPIERILSRHPAVAVVAVYGVPSPVVGDDAMAAVQTRPGVTLSPQGLSEFLTGQRDLHAKGAPRYVRLMSALPTTVTNKVRKRELRSWAWAARPGEELWWCPAPGAGYRPFTADDADDLATAFASRGRESALAGFAVDAADADVGTV